MCKSKTESPDEESPAQILPAYLAERFRDWKQNDFVESRDRFAELAEKGQSPQTMVISCCDSRVDPTMLFGAGPGELFIVRNVANLVPPYAPDHAHHGTSAAIEFAVTGLGVRHIVVIGHAHCGGVKAYLERRDGGMEAVTKTSFIDRWTDILAPAYERLPEVDPTDSKAQRLQALEKQGVLSSLRNLMGFPFVKEAVEAGRLSLHGAWFDIGEGALHSYDPATERFVQL